MSELSFSIAGSRVERYAAAPTLMFKLRVAETAGEQIHAVLLRFKGHRALATWDDAIAALLKEAGQRPGV